MRDTKQIHQIKKVVKEALAADFDNLKIVDVRIQEDVDADGEELLRIEVIFEGAPKLDARKISGAIRYLRPKLTAIKETAFPLLSFISGADLEPGKVGAA
jgi:hypothetical protein